VKGFDMDNRYAIGIDLGGTNLKGIVMDEQGQWDHLTRIPTEAHLGGAHVLERILELIEALLSKHGRRDDVVGVGIGSPGFIDRDGTVLGGAENIPGWKGTQVFAPVQQRFGLKAVAGNDVTVAALAEARFGAGRGINNMVLLAMGTGIGGGIVSNGHVYMGTHGMAGELGHIPVQRDGLLCTCGQRGCVEQYASGSGMVKNAYIIAAQAGPQEQTPFVNHVLYSGEPVTAKSVYEFVENGSDPVALRYHEYIMERLARAIGIVLNAFAPDRVVLGGGVMRSEKVILQTLARQVPNHCWAAIWERTDIVAAQCGQDAGVLGAAALIFDKFNACAPQ
jgi:glucokinase